MSVSGPTPAELVLRARFAAPVARATVEASWRDRGYGCFEMVDPPGQVWADFVHETNELVCVVTGRLRLTIDGESISAGPGDEVFIPRRAVHTVENAGPEPVRWIFGYD